MSRRAYVVASFVSAWLVLGQPALAANAERTFTGVTPEIFECTKQLGEARHGTVYEPRYGNHGVSTASSFFWIIVIEYTFVPEAGELRHQILRKSWIIPEEAVWEGIADQIAECSAR